MISLGAGVIIVESGKVLLTKREGNGRYKNHEK